VVSITTAHYTKGQTIVTETPESRTEQAAAGSERRDWPNRLGQLAAWVGIVAGAAFVVAVIFLSGVYTGSQFGSGESGAYEHHDESSAGIDDKYREGSPEDGDHHGETSWGQGGAGPQPSMSVGPTAPSSPHP
jgi:hypothetical protein